MKRFTTAKSRANPVMILASLLALGVAVERLVNGPTTNGLEIVSQPAFASLPEEPDVQVQETRVSQAQIGDGLWLAAFGTPVISEQELIIPEEEIVEEEIIVANPEPVETNEYWLTGLIMGDGQALALVHDGDEEQVVRLGTDLSGGETVVDIKNDSILARRDGETIRIGFPDQEENW